MSFQTAKRRLIIFYLWMICSCIVEVKKDWNHQYRQFVFSEDTGMEFGIKKCAMLVTEKGEIVKSVGIELPDGKVITSLQEGESYKYVGILEANKFLEDEVECFKGINLKVKKNFEVKTEQWEFSSWS